MNDRICKLKDEFLTLIEDQMNDLEHIDAKEMGMVIDIVKDLAEMAYYCSVVEAMENSDDKSDFMPDSVRSRMYYNNDKTWDDVYEEIETLMDSATASERASVKQKLTGYINRM